MISTQEPKDGDFVAYIEQLQQESAARLLGQHHSLNQLEKPSSTAGKSSSHFFASRARADVRAAGDANAALMQLASGFSPGRLLSAAVAVVLGVLLALYWLLTSASIVLLAIGIALVFWGMHRIKRVAQRLSPQKQQAQALVSKAFGVPSKAK